MMARITTCSLLALLLTACASTPIDRPDSVLEISRIRIDPIDRSANGDPQTVSRCSGFILSEREVHNFLTHAARFRDNGSDRHNRLLPCSSAGTALINGRKYRWLIRTGGIGELVAGTDRFVAVCGKGCCDKVPGIC